MTSFVFFLLALLFASWGAFIHMGASLGGSAEKALNGFWSRWGVSIESKPTLAYGVLNAVAMVFMLLGVYFL